LPDSPLEEEDIKGATRQEATEIELGRMARDFMKHPFFPYYTEILDGSIEELTQELLRDHDTEQQTRWFDRLLWDPRKYYIYSQSLKKVIRVLAKLRNSPEDYIIHSKNLLDDIRKRERRSL
jgi:hypothetical protein